VSVSREYGADWYVSWHNFEGPTTSESRSFVIHDTTLRDGEQQAGVLFTAEEKIHIAKALGRLGVDRIEAGMVAVSEEDRHAIRAIVDLGLDSEIWTVARSLREDVAYAVESGVSGVGVILSANEQFCEIFGWSLEEALQKALTAAEQAKAAGLKTALLMLDSPRMARERLQRIVSAATSSGMFDALTLMDTFGSLSPVGAHHLVETVRDATDLPIELHAHNDFGLGNAIALAGLEAGASVIHTSMLGIGERVGNTALEQLAVAAPLLYGFEHKLDLGQLQEVADLVRRYARINISPNQPVIGTSFTQIESGTVASEFARWSAQGRDLQWLFPFAPRLVGGPNIELVIGKGSGLANVEAALARTDIQLTQEGKRELLDLAKDKAIELHRLLSAEEFKGLANDIASSAATASAAASRAT
jgi:isopropylmalate/homocitrate/citramalate synthase